MRFLFLLILIPFINKAQNTCDTSTYTYVHEPERFSIKQQCITVEGIVTHRNKELDGDILLRIKLDKKYEYLLNEVNRKKQHGKMVAEFICACKVKREEAKAGCSKYQNNLKIPFWFQRVRITGRYVEDKNHGWMEIHPVVKVEKINSD